MKDAARDRINTPNQTFNLGANFACWLQSHFNLCPSSTVKGTCSLPTYELLRPPLTRLVAETVLQLLHDHLH